MQQLTTTEVITKGTRLPLKWPSPHRRRTWTPAWAPPQPWSTIRRHQPKIKISRNQTIIFLTKFPKWKSPTCKTFSAIIVTAAEPTQTTRKQPRYYSAEKEYRVLCRRVKPSQTPHRTLVFYVSLMCDAFNAATLVSYSCLTDDFLQTSSFPLSLCVKNTESTLKKTANTTQDWTENNRK